MISLWDEHLFWLEMLQDHAFFVRDHLSPSEVQYVNMAQQYIHLYGELLTVLNTIPRTANYFDRQMIEFAGQVWPVAKGYLDFEGHLQALRIDNKVNLNLSPSYFNGTQIENAEYLRILSQLAEGKDPVPLPLPELMDLWLEDQLGHAVLFENMLDPIEVMAKRQAEAYISKYQLFIVQNHQLKGFLRVKEPGFARQREFIHDVGSTTLEMNRFIIGMVDKFKSNKLLNKTDLRFLEHHFPETCYFLTKLSYYDPKLKAEISNCSLVKPSFH
ncbi:DUF2935 domain-containing protein [Heyndrickxia sp. MSNUG]|uniref:DUF2935 domain-containing protein n=1 Tax=Heyndrickxia sp. MSNUG TaxID=3136677 RepID=UPI003C2DE338